MSIEEVLQQRPTETRGDGTVPTMKEPSVETKKINNYDTELDELLDCPFCGGRPTAHLIGNEYTKTRKIVIKCQGCRVQRTVGAIKMSTEWLENTSIKLWNTRSKGNMDIEEIPMFKGTKEALEEL